MKVFKSIETIRVFLAVQRNKQLKIGLVPTMGALHEGHICLVDKAKKHNDIVVVSIFVNPAQFNKKEDLDKYPRNIERDVKLLRDAGCNSVFLPSVDEMYQSEESLLRFDVGYFDGIMEGKFRPRHFAGVALVVSKLFNIVDPDNSYFGQKDLQQLVLIRTLQKELNFRTEIVKVPTVREVSGLAKSSRNERLDENGLRTALNVFKGLKLLEAKILTGAYLKNAIEEVEEFYNEIEGFELEYLQVVETDNLKSIREYMPEIKTSICVAGYVAGVRLLDNICI
ncbi:MAG: pantoate--beta-alanine ligase [Algoriphagus sp.]